MTLHYECLVYRTEMSQMSYILTSFKYMATEIKD